MLDKDITISGALALTQLTGTSLQTNEMFQNIQLVLSICSTLVVLAFTLWKWWKRANEDKKISIDEISEGLSIVNDAIDYVEDKLNERKDENE